VWTWSAAWVDRDQEDILDSGGRKGRSVVDMGEMVYQALRIAKRWRQTDHVIEYNGNPVKDIHQGLKAAMRRAGIDEKFFGAHAFRHSAATWIADTGIDLRKVQKLLGHESFDTTDQIYAGHSPGYLTGAVDVLDQIIQGGEPGALQLDTGDSPKSGRGEMVPGSMNRTQKGKPKSGGELSD
jgi:integrase